LSLSPSVRPMTTSSFLFAWGMPGPFETLIILVLAVLLYGQRLPEVARKVGKGFAEFQKGLRGLESELHTAINSSVSSSSSSSASSGKSAASAEYTTYDDMLDHEEATAPKFEPPLAETKDAGSPAQPAAAAVAAQPAGKTAEA
jgi:sec-independent protein translocase protein TatA